MQHRLILVLALLALAAFGLNQAFAADTTKVYLPLISCPTCTGTGTTTPPPTQTPTPGANVSRMIELVNQARAAVGCPAVTAHASMMQGAQDLYALNDFTGSLETAEKALELHPQDAVAQALVKRNQDALLKMFEAKIGNLTVRIIDVMTFRDDGKVASMQAYFGPEDFIQG